MSGLFLCKKYDNLIYILKKIHKKIKDNVTELIKICKINENGGNLQEKRCIMTIS